MRNDWLVVPWIQACQGVLSNTPYKNEKPVYLKKISERSPHFISVDLADAQDVLKRLSPVMGPGFTHDLVSIFSVKHLLNQTRSLWKNANNEKAAGEAPAAPTDVVGDSSPTHIGDIGV
jgi:hypothetical protein